MFEAVNQIAAIREQGRADRAKIWRDANDTIREIDSKTKKALSDIDKVHAARKGVIDELRKAAEDRDLTKLRGLLGILKDAPNPQLKPIQQTFDVSINLCTQNEDQ